MITFKTYDYWPKLDLLRNEPRDRYDFIGFGFQLTLDAVGNQKDYLTFFAYVVVDKYQDEINLTFDFATENDGRTIYWNLSREKEKKTRVRKIKISNSYDNLTLKPEKELIIQAPNITDFLQANYEAIVGEKITQIEQYAKKHEISFDQESFRAWEKCISEDFSKLDSESFINNACMSSQTYPLTSSDFLNVLKTTIAYEQLQKKLNTEKTEPAIRRLKV